MLVCGADGQRIASLVSWLGCSVVPGAKRCNEGECYTERKMS